MAIRINLLAEQQFQEELARRDPVKRGYWLAGLLAALMLLWSISIQLQSWSASSEARRLEQGWRSLEAKTSQVKTNLKNTAEIEDKLAALNRLATERFLWAPVLNALQFSLVDEVQVTRLSTKHHFLYTPEIKAKNTGKVQPAVATETNAFFIEAKCNAESSVERIDQFIRRLKTQEYLRTIFTNEAGVGLKARGEPQVNPLEGGKPFITFTLECDLPEKERQ